MKKRIGALLLSLMLLLTGCSWMDGSYVYVEPHVEQGGAAQTGSVSAADYMELIAVLEQLVRAGTETCTIDIGDFDKEEPAGYINAACHHIRTASPMGAYAVEEVKYELGSNNGRPAVAVNILYRRSRTEIQRVRKKADMEALAEAVREALNDHSSRVVFLVEQYTEMDFQQLVEDYAREAPQLLMEIPQISEGIYGSGDSRVVELSFIYQNSRESLRQMQSRVEPVFEAAALYVSGEGSEHQKLSQLGGFLSERFDYKLETSITPTYSLLCHGVGDSRAFAEVYAAMCRQAGLECLIVTGTRDGAPWTWNIVKDGEHHYHVDLLRPDENGDFHEYSDMEMAGYVWDYSAYPVCDIYYQEELPEEVLVEETTEETAEPSEASEEYNEAGEIG